MKSVMSFEFLVPNHYMYLQMGSIGGFPFLHFFYGSVTSMLKLILNEAPELRGGSHRACAVEQ